MWWMWPESDALPLLPAEPAPAVTLVGVAVSMAAPAGGAPQTGLDVVLVDVLVEPLYKTAPCVDVPSEACLPARSSSKFATWDSESVRAE
jgi:hypothetical protein